MSEILSVSDKEKRARLIRTTLETINNLSLQRDEITSKTKAEYDVLEAQGLSRKAIKDAARMMALEEKKRFEYEKTKAIVYDAMGWQFQPDLFAGDVDHAPAAQPGIGADNLDLLGEIDTSDDPGEGEDLGDFTRDEVTEQRRLSSVG